MKPWPLRSRLRVVGTRSRCNATETRQTKICQTIFFSFLRAPLELSVSGRPSAPGRAEDAQRWRMCNEPTSVRSTGQRRWRCEIVAWHRDGLPCRRDSSKAMTWQEWHFYILSVRVLRSSERASWKLNYCSSGELELAMQRVSQALIARSADQGATRRCTRQRRHTRICPDSPLLSTPLPAQATSNERTVLQS